MIRFACPKCHQSFHVEDKSAGKKTKCPKCGAALSVPVPERSATPDPLLPPPAVKPVAAAATDDTYGLATEKPAHKQDEFWNTLDQPASEPPSPMPSRTAPIRTQTTRAEHKSRRKGPSMPLLAVGGVVLLAIAAGAALWAVTKSKSTREDQIDAQGTMNDAGVANAAKAKAEAEVAQALAAKAKSEAEVAKAKAEAEKAKAEAEAARVKAEAAAIAAKTPASSPTGQGGNDTQNTEERAVQALKQGTEGYVQLVSQSDYALTEVAYDVQKSNSLVSPYVAILTYKSCVKTLQDNPYSWYEHRDTLGWQNGRWATTGRLMRSLGHNSPLRDARSREFMRVGANGELSGGYAREDLFSLEDKAFSR